MLFEFVKDMHQRTAIPNLDIASLVGPLFFTWVVLQLFPVCDLLLLALALFDLSIWFACSYKCF